VILSVVVPTHNPDQARLARTLAGLRAQTLPPEAWELVLVDNASRPSLVGSALSGVFPSRGRLVHEPVLGLTAARLRGFREAQGGIVVLADDDNVLAPDYLARVTALFAADPQLGAAGGRSVPEFESPPAPWAGEFFGLLALRDLGDRVETAAWRPGEPRVYPRCAPIGAGMALRRRFALDYAAALERDATRRALDRAGSALTSGGDNDLVLSILEAGASVGYFPELSLTHLIPARRTGQEYLGALNRGIARSWVRVLAMHEIRPWPPVVPFTVPLRQVRAWWRTRAWSGPAAWVRWQGRCGQFEGQADLHRTRRT
jgi:glycosyltransferase involved in cell wall biosynthesis